MGKPNDLCTLAELRGWIGQVSTDEDAVLQRLISGASGDILTYLNRSSLLKKSYTQVFNRIGNNGRLSLLNYPVLSVASVTANGTAIEAAATPGLNVVPNSGYLLDIWDGIPPGRPQSLNFVGGCAPCGIGFQGLSVTYAAGYAIADEAQTVPSTANGNTKFLVNVTAPYGPWSADNGVTYADGDALQLVSSAPAAGEYQLSAVPGEYLFNMADADEDILISYSYVPYAVNQACVEIAAERWKYKTRIGESSQTVSGQRTSAYRDQAMTPYVKSLLDSYRRVTPYG